MANSTQLSKAAAESIGGFFSASQENLQQEKKKIEPETQEIQKEKQAKSITQTTKKPQTTSKRLQSKKNVLKEEIIDKSEANTKPKKQTFSFRAAVEDIINWKAYATATGQTMETIGTAAMKEYLINHTLTGKEQIIFEAMKERDKNK